MLAEGLHWSIRRSFARYVAGLADGRLVVDDGVKPTENDQLFFPLEVSRVSESLLPFRGSASFSGHFGMLAVRIAQPTLRLDPDHAGGMLRVAGSDGGVDFATFTLEREESSNKVSLFGRSVRLTAPAAALFGGVYAAQESLGAMVVIISPRGRQCPAGGAPSWHVSTSLNSLGEDRCHAS